MRKQRHPRHAENHDRWLVSYADFITLMFAFFVLMYASAEANQAKVNQVAESVRRALDEGRLNALLAGLLTSNREAAVAKAFHPARQQPVKAPESPKQAVQHLAELLPSLKKLQKDLHQEIASGKLEISMEARGLVISLRQAAYFPSGEDNIDPSMYPSLGKVAEAVRNMPNPVRFEGHTDSIPISNVRFRSNWDLSAARSIAMLKLFASTFGIPANRMAVVGYADTSPIESNATEAGRARNRRVDIVVLNASGVQAEPEKKPEPPLKSG